MGLPLTPAHWLSWSAALAFVLHAIHVPRMSTYWEREIETYLPMAVPKQVFYPVYLIALVCHAGFGALFFTNATADPLFDWAVVLWFAWVGVVMLTIWFYSTPVSFWPVGPLATIALLINVTLLILAIVYGDTRAWLIGFESVAILWSLLMTIAGWFVSVKLGPKFGIMKQSVAELTNGTIAAAGGNVEPMRMQKSVTTTAPLLKENAGLTIPLSSLQRRPYNA